VHPLLARRVLNPLIFGLRREPVSRLRRQIEAHQWRDCETVRQEQLAAVEAVVRTHGVGNAAYAQMLAGVGWDGDAIRVASDLESLPVMGKPELARVATEVPRSPVGVGRYTTRLTGGSTGAPAVVYAPPAASAASLAARAVCQGWYGVRSGDRQLRLWGRRLDTARWQASVKDLLLNRIRVDSFALEPDCIADTLARAEKFGCEYLYGYASLIDLLGRRIDDLGLIGVLPGLKAAISTSETMLPGQKARLARTLGCPVVNEYGCSEVDIIAFECPRGGQHIVAANVLVEVVRFGGEPEGFGQVVVTDLRNTLMPVIRYRLGDLARLSDDQCECGRGWPLMAELLGRDQGQYVRTADGRLLHSQFLVYVLEELVATGMPIGRFKIVQQADGSLIFRVAPRPGATIASAEIEASLRKACEPSLGDGCEYRVVLTSEGEFESERQNKFRHFESMIDGP
jgi:phenylacetate-CoA ligase